MLEAQILQPDYEVCDLLIVCALWDGHTVNRGKVAFANPGAVLRYCIGQTFLATFLSYLDLLRACIQQLEH